MVDGTLYEQMDEKKNPVDVVTTKSRNEGLEFQATELGYRRRGTLGWSFRREVELYHIRKWQSACA